MNQQAYPSRPYPHFRLAQSSDNHVPGTTSSANENCNIINNQGSTYRTSFVFTTATLSHLSSSSLNCHLVSDPYQHGQVSNQTTRIYSCSNGLGTMGSCCHAHHRHTQYMLINESSIKLLFSIIIASLSFNVCLLCFIKATSLLCECINREFKRIHCAKR